jgi:hypothetical protein
MTATPSKHRTPRAWRLDLVVLGLLFWLPLEGWALKFVPGGSLALVLPDVVSIALGLVAVTLIVQSARRGTLRSGTVRVAPTGVLLLAAALISWAVNRVPLVDAVYWLRVYLRFVPLAVVASIAPWSGRIAKRLAPVAAVILGIQIVVGLSEVAFGKTAAAFFWPGQYRIGAFKTAVNTLPRIENRFVAGTTGHYNLYGLLLVLLVTILLGRAFSRRPMPRRVRTILWVEIALGSVMILLSQSRQAAAAYLLVLLLSAWWASRSGRDARLSGTLRTAIGAWGLPVRLAAAAVVVCLGVGVVAISMPLLLRYRELLTSQYWEKGSLNRGYAVTAVATAVMKADPVLGMGPGSFWTGNTSDGRVPIGVERLGLDPIYARYVEDVGWVNVFSQVGLIGVAALLTLVAFLVRVLRRARCRARQAFAAIGCLAILLVGMMASTPIVSKPNSAVMWVLAGIAMAGDSAIARGIGGRKVGPGSKRS